MNKRTVSIVSLFLPLLLLSTLLTPAGAVAKHQKYFKLNSVVKGSGIMYWGIAGLPTVQWGELDYSVILDESEVNIAGVSDAQEELVSWPAEKMLSLSNIQLDKNEFTIIWTFEDTRYELRLSFLSDSETDGMYGFVWVPRQGDGLVYDTLEEALSIGIDLSISPDVEMFNPIRSTLQFEGTYKENDEEVVISGKAWISAAEFHGTGFYGKGVGLYLWINELEEYATLGWYSKELVGVIPGTEQVPPAQVLNIYMKEKK